MTFVTLRSIKVDSKNYRWLEALTTNGRIAMQFVLSDGRSLMTYPTDKSVAYQVTKLWVMDKNGENKRLVSTNLDRSVYDTDATLLKHLLDMMIQRLTNLLNSKDGNNFKILVEDIRGTTGKTLPSGQYISDKGSIAYTLSSYDRPARLAISQKKELCRFVMTLTHPF